MRKAVASHDFQVDKTDNGIVFSYKKGKLGLRAYLSLIWPSLIMAIFLSWKIADANQTLTTPTEKLSMGVFYTVALSLLMPMVAVISINLLRRSGTFSFNEHSVTLGGLTYPYTQSGGFYFKSPNGTTSEIVSFTGFSSIMVFSNDRMTNLVYGSAAMFATGVSAAVGAATWLSRLSGQEFGKSLNLVRYRVCFHFGSSEVSLAKGLSKKQAIDLFSSLKALKQ